MVGIKDRKLRVLEAVIREFLLSAEPVGSGTLVGKYRLNVSSATVRNDMADLTEQGLLEQPHTSAGRRPTEAGYRIFVEQFVGDGLTIAVDMLQQMEIIIAEVAHQQEVAARNLAHYLADLTDEAAFVGLGDSVYLTGLSNLFGKPEFHSVDMMSEFSTMVDRIDELVRSARTRLDSDFAVLIGHDNPFCSYLSSVVTRWPDHDGLLGIIGSTRMDYDRNIGIMRSIKKTLVREEPISKIHFD